MVIQWKWTRTGLARLALCRERKKERKEKVCFVPKVSHMSQIKENVCNRGIKRDDRICGGLAAQGTNISCAFKTRAKQWIPGRVIRPL